MDRMNSVETGARIAALRKERGMTQRDLAQLVGVSDKAVSKWERGVSHTILLKQPTLISCLNS